MQSCFLFLGTFITYERVQLVLKINSWLVDLGIQYCIKCKRKISLDSSFSQLEFHASLTGVVGLILKPALTCRYYVQSCILDEYTGLSWNMIPVSLEVWAVGQHELSATVVLFNLLIMLLNFSCFPHLSCLFWYVYWFYSWTLQNSSSSCHGCPSHFCLICATVISDTS